MAKKSSRNTKARIVSAAWKLFYEQGYEETTVEEIIFESETSKGSFYHYFDGKDALLSSLSVLFDERYEELMQQPHDEMDCIELLCWLNQELFTTIENTVSIELLARLFSSQLVTKGEKHLLDRGRTYFKLLTQVVRTGQERGELSRAVTANEIATEADFFSFGTNDLTQTTFGFSRDDVEGEFVPQYLNEHLLPYNPFATIDAGVAKLVEMGVALGHEGNPDLVCGVCV